MALPLSGKIGLGNIRTELDLTGTIALDDEPVRELLDKPSGKISLSDGYGKSGEVSIPAAVNLTNLNLRTWALQNGWNGTSKFIFTVQAGVYIYSTSTSVPALTIDGSWPGGVTVINNGFIIGMGGAGGERVDGTNAGAGPGFAGGSAISLGVSCSIQNNSYIAGGGGGGAGSSGSAGGPIQGCGGGGGAGGGNGGRASRLTTASTVPAGGGPGASGANGGAPSNSTNARSGAGGGRILPGTGGAGSSTPSVNSVGGGAGGGGGTATAINSQGQPVGSFSGGGGGGWGAAGGNSQLNGSSGGAGGGADNAGANGGGTAFNPVRPGGAGGLAVQLNGNSVTWLATGTRWGAIS